MPKPLSTVLHTRTATGRPARLGRSVALSMALAMPLLAAPALAQVAPQPPTAPVAPAASAPAAPMAPMPAAPMPAAPMPAAPMQNAAMPGAPAAPAQQAAAGPIDANALQAAVGHDKAARIEAHIDRLHSDLKITASQEPLWQAFSGTMRSNAVQMEAAYGRRQQSYAGMNAVQDLQSYGEVEQTSARNIAGLLPPFQALYASMSPQQQKLADGIFVRHIDKAVKKPG